MAPTPPLTTSRLLTHYTGPLASHTMIWHGVTGVTMNDLVAAVRAVIDEMVDIQFNGTTWDAAEYAPAGQSFTVPITWAAITSTNPPTPTDADGAGKFLQFGGRGTDGVRMKLYMFETPAQLRADMRYQASDSDEVFQVIETLQANDGIIGTVSGSTVSFYPYANIKNNDHLVHKAR